MSAAASALASARRAVIKVGSSLVTNEGRGLDAGAIARWAAQISALHQLGKQVILVSSGAIAEGMQRLGWSRRPQQIHDLQAAAAVGQMGLAQAYESGLAAHGLRSAQVLLTHADLADRARYLNARSTLMTLLNLRVVPVINENDTVVTDEIKFGDNDTLAALVTNLVEADVLVILTDQAGLFSADPRTDPGAVLVERAEAGDPALEAIAAGPGSAISSGGMLTKVLAAKRAARSGACTIIASGREDDVLVRLANGVSIGTELTSRHPVLTARRARGRGVLRRAGRTGGRARVDQLLERRSASDRPQAQQRDRRNAGLHRGARADTPRQPRGALTGRRKAAARADDRPSSLRRRATVGGSAPIRTCAGLGGTRTGTARTGLSGRRPA